MKDQTKKKKQLIEELEVLRKQAAELRKAKTKLKQLKRTATDLQYWQSIFDSIKEAVCLIDMQGKIMQCNKAMANLVKKPISKVIGSTWWELMHGTSEPIQECPFVRIKETHKRETLTLPIGNRWFEVTTDPIFDKAGRLSRCVHIIVDITKRKKTEETLRKEHYFCSSVINNAGEGICVCHNIPEYPYVKFTVWNNRMTELTGYTMEEINKYGWYQTVYPDPEIRARAVERMERMRHGDDLYAEAWEIVRKGGEKRILSITTSIIESKEGSVHVMAVMDDITEQKRVEKEILQGRRDWEDIFQAIGHPTIILDAQHNILSVNRATINVVGADSAGELIGRKCYEIFHNTTEPPEGCPVANMLISTKLEENEMEVEALGGVFFVSCTPVFDEKGHVQKIIHIAMDITEHKRVQEALRDSEATLKKAQKVSHVGSWVWHIKENRLEWSDEMYRIFGIDKKDFSGDMSEVIGCAIHPDDRVAVERANLSVIQDKTPMPLEYRVVWPDGTICTVWAEAGELILDDAGNPVVLTGIVQDITDRKRVEEMLRLSEERYRVLFEGALDGIALAEAETGILLDCNQSLADLVGRKRAELIGQHQAILHPPSSNNTGFSLTFKQHLTSQEGQVLETQVITATGEIREVEIKANLLYLQGRKMLQGIFRDITERKRAEDEIKKRIKELQDFYEMAVGRELRMIELKEQVEELKEELSKYKKTEDK